MGWVAAVSFSIRLCSHVQVSSVKVRLSLQRAKDSFDNVYVGVKPGQMLLDLMMRMDSAHIKVRVDVAAVVAGGAAAVLRCLPSCFALLAARTSDVRTRFGKAFFASNDTL